MLEYSVRLVHTPPHSDPFLVVSNSTITTTAARPSERTAASLNVYHGKSVALTLILSQEAPKQTCIIWGTTPRKLAFPVRATKTLAVARKGSDSNFVRTCLRTQSTTKLNQKLTKKTLDTRAFTRGNTYVRT